MTSRTKSNTAFSIVLERPRKQKILRKLELLPNASVYQKRDYYLKVFKDPSDAEALMQRSVTCASPASCKFCENIFKAVVFLHTCLRDRAHMDDESFRFGCTRNSPTFKEMATELGLVEPSLRSVTALALVSLYNRIIKERRALNDFLAVATGFTWSDTRMSEMAQELLNIDNELRERENRQRAARRGARRPRVTGAEVTERQLATTMVGTLTRRKRRALEEDIEEEDIEEEDLEEQDIEEEDIKEEDSRGTDDDAVASQQQPPASPIVSALGSSSLFSDTRQRSSQLKGGSFALRSNTLRKKARYHEGTPSTAQVHRRRMSSASESTDDGDALPLPPRAPGETSSIARPSPKYRGQSTMAETDRVSALVARMDQLEAQNRLLRMELMQLSQSTQRSVDSIDDELEAYSSRSLQAEEQLALTQSQMKVRSNQTELNLTKLSKKTRDLDSRITALENANRLQTPFP
ncbi:hypothetical protein DFQ27_004595 [Actinomortierella ambigua]|uniref:Uncharacterized protein n=1 Tax=Actinomortierella ambigua TaxID=1343610 RepID=A0A9P6U371_9FUNG|nr:hypothetical protein DFQ27_004595 [Actinomortierella ambigua]